MTDILDLIDEATATACGWCQQLLSAAGVSAYFCDDECQFEWQRLRGEALVGYREPVDLAVHVQNLDELESPETTPTHSTATYGALAAYVEYMRAAFEATFDQFVLYGTPYTLAWTDETSAYAGVEILHQFQGLSGFVEQEPDNRSVEIRPGHWISLPDGPVSVAMQHELPEVAPTAGLVYDVFGYPAVAPHGLPERVEPPTSPWISPPHGGLGASRRRRDRAPRTIRPGGCS